MGMWDVRVVTISGVTMHTVSELCSMPCLQECHCMLFLTPENEFRGEDQTISREEVDAVSQPGY